MVTHYRLLKKIKMARIHEIAGWVNGVSEEIIDPDRPIIDPHHHLWHGPKNPPGIKESYRYLLEDLWNDTSSGHNIKKTVTKEEFVNNLRLETYIKVKKRFKENLT